MKTDRKIFQAFNIKTTNVSNENVYVPINETWLNIRKELLKLK